MAAYVTRIFLQDRPETPGDPVPLRGCNMAATSYTRCEGSLIRRAALAIRIVGRLKTTRGWGHDAIHTIGVQNVVADGMSRRLNENIARNLQTLVQGEYREQRIVDQRGCELFEKILKPHFPTIWVTLYGRR